MKAMKNQHLIYLCFLVLFDPSLGFVFGKKEKKTTPFALYPSVSSSLCPIGEPLKEDVTNRVISCSPGLYSNCPMSHECKGSVCCLLPEERQFNPCKTGSPLMNPVTKAFVSCKFNAPDKFTCAEGYTCNTNLQDVPSVCCPNLSSGHTSGKYHDTEMHNLASNISSLWEKVHELEKCCKCSTTQSSHSSRHDPHHHHHHHHHHHDEDKSHEDDQHISQQHGEHGSHYHQHKHGEHEFDDSKSTEVHAHCEMKPNGALSILKTVPIRGFVHLKQKGYSPLEMHIQLHGWPLTKIKRFIDIYVHEYGDLRNGCESVGDYYNPGNATHGSASDSVRHPGDFGHFEVKPDGKITHHKSDNMASLRGKFSIIGRSIVIHESFDDSHAGHGIGYSGATSRPSENSGTRLACCIIGHTGQDH